MALTADCGLVACPALAAFCYLCSGIKLFMPETSEFPPDLISTAVPFFNFRQPPEELSETESA